MLYGLVTSFISSRQHMRVRSQALPTVSSAVETETISKVRVFGQQDATWANVDVDANKLAFLGLAVVEVNDVANLRYSGMRVW